MVYNLFILDVSDEENVITKSKIRVPNSAYSVHMFPKSDNKILIS